MKKLIVALSLSICSVAALAAGGGAVASAPARTQVSLEVVEAGKEAAKYEMHLSDGETAPLLSATDHAIAESCSVGPSGVPKVNHTTLRTGLLANVGMKASSASDSKLVSIDATIVDLVGRSKISDGHGCMIDLPEMQSFSARSEIVLKRGERFELVALANASRQVFVRID